MAPFYATSTKKIKADLGYGRKRMALLESWANQGVFIY